ncbi:MAG: hypothetical protein FJ035_02215 [Chloroflexi bacterium]|nr:hypothetical protein [Chloroflexota bacterium]
MQAVLCDICEQPIRGEALELHMIRGEAVSFDEGRPRVAQRGGASMQFLCAGCGGWLRDAMGHLRAGMRAVAPGA